jgi:hypothetical protein
MKNTVTKKSMPKAQLGALIKGIKGAIKGGKAAYQEARAAKAAKKAAGYGDSGQYARLEDMKRSEAYRKRDGTRSNSAIPIGVAATVATSKDNKRKVAANKAKVKANAEKVKANKLKKAGKYKFATGGSTFGMLSVKAGIDKNPKPTAADRIAGATKNKKKMGGVTKPKKK